MEGSVGRSTQTSAMEREWVCSAPKVWAHASVGVAIGARPVTADYVNFSPRATGSVRMRLFVAA